MCGIAGELSFDGRDVAPGHVLAMAEAIAHRGPDDHGLFCEGVIGLGHRRLSIIDLSANGHQPMWTVDRSLAIVFNGEIYNFREIRHDLVARGYRFVSASDTEVILNAVDCWGLEAALGRFVGMFAFALWDATTRTLFLCRDRPGVKPMYYYVGPDRLLFGSELKALMAHPAYPRDLDRASVARYFVLGYLPGAPSVFRDTFRLPPAHYLQVRVDGTTILKQYWRLEDTPRGSYDGSFDSAAGELETLCARAFEDRLVSDVPVGMFLSGGIDSTFVSGILKRHAGADLLHITIGFDYARYDESGKATAVAKRLGVRHVVHHVDSRQAQDALHQFAAIYDEPFGDTSGIPTLILSALARKHVKVALSADGGDEAFCGYDSYGRYATLYRQTRRVPGSLRRIAASLLRHAVPYQLLLSATIGRRRGRTRTPQWVSRYEKLVDVIGAEDAGDLIRIMNEKGWPADRVRDLVRDAAGDLLEGSALFPGPVEVEGDDLIDLMMRTDYASFLSDDILVKVDRASMASSLECRDPLLDHRVLEFARTLPVSFLWDGHEYKRVLKHLCRPWVGRDVVDAPKQGFSIPLYDWLRGPWRPLVADYLSRGRVAAVGVLDPAMVAREVEQFYRFAGGKAERVMLMLLFQMWAERWYLTPRPTPRAVDVGVHLVAS